MSKSSNTAATGSVQHTWQEQLRNLIKGRESSDEPLDGGQGQGRKPIMDLVIPTHNQGNVLFKVHADTKCNALNDFLTAVRFKETKIEVVTGPQGGVKLGINGKSLKGLQIYVKK